MPVTALHPRYEELRPQWRRVRDALAGQDAVKHPARREMYVPRLEGQQGEYEGDYEKYIKRALWGGYSARTLAGLVGAVFRKDPGVDFPESQRAWLTDVTLSGQTLTDFARMAFREAMALNWTAILVDMPRAEESLPESQRPHLALYTAESIINWRLERRQGAMAIVQVVLLETFEEPAEDGFGAVEMPQYRVLSLSPDLYEGGALVAGGEYSQQLWRKQKTADNKEEWLPFGPRIVPLRREEPLTFIPFYPVSANGLGFQLDSSRMLDLVDANLDHFRLDADYKHGLHFTALPTAWLAGFPVDETYRIGSQTAWVSENPAARAGFSEFSGAGLGAIQAAKESNEKMMAVLGARLLEESRRAVEAAETIQLRQAGEESIVKQAARAVSASLTRAGQTMSWWGGQEDPAVDIRLNTDIVSAQMSPQMLTALLGALQQNAISERTFLEALVSGEVIHGRTWEEEQELIQLTAPPELRAGEDVAA